MNLTKAQIAKKFADAGVRQPNFKLNDDELQAFLSQRTQKFADAKGKERRSRSNTKRRALRDW